MNKTHTDFRQFKDHEISRIVNALRDISKTYSAHQCLREMISQYIVTILQRVLVVGDLTDSINLDVKELSVCKNTTNSTLNHTYVLLGLVDYSPSTPLISFKCRNDADRLAGELNQYYQNKPSSYFKINLSDEEIRKYHHDVQLWEDGLLFKAFLQYDSFTVMECPAYE